jgi:hypothetical protein
MRILFGIDGTDDWYVGSAARNAAYDQNFRRSFVRRLCFGKGPNASYERGPRSLGGGLMDAINRGVDFVNQRRAAVGNTVPILLTGYSRGAAGAVMIAKRLNEQRPPVYVHAMMLFDCVDRYVFGDASVVPGNVVYLNHVMRNPAARSRGSFGNDATRYTRGTHAEVARRYMCTHGGMGGCPWRLPNPAGGLTLDSFIDEGALEENRWTPWNDTTAITYRRDALVSEQIWNDLQPYLSRHFFLTQ